MRSKAIFMALLALMFSARGAITDYVCDDITGQMAPGWPSTARVQYWHKDTAPKGKAWVVRFDLTDKHWRFLTRLGRDNDTTANNRLANMQTMADAIVKEDSSRKPLVAINGNYFTNPQDRDEKTGAYLPINCYGTILSDFVTVQGGDYPLVQAADLRIKLNEKFPLGTKLRNGSSFFADPPIRYANGEFNVDTQTTYPRSLVGVGDNVFVFLVSDGSRGKAELADWATGVLDRDAVEMVVSNDCHTVAENDGGGSAQMWIKDLPSSLPSLPYPDYPRDENFINKGSDGSPRAVAEGLFMLYEDEFVERARIGDDPVNPFENMDDAMKALSNGDAIEVEDEIMLRGRDRRTTKNCTIFAAGNPDARRVTIASNANWTIESRVLVSNLMVIALGDLNQEVPAIINVVSNGELRIGANVSFGGEGARIKTMKNSNLRIVGKLKEPLVVECEVANGAGNRFAQLDATKVSGLDLDATLQNLRHPSDPYMVATAEGSGEYAGLYWKRGVVRIGERLFATLDEAFAAAKRMSDPPLVEILVPMTNASPIVVDCACALTITNADWHLAVKNSIAVADGGWLHLQDIVITNVLSHALAEVNVMPGGCIAASGVVGVKQVNLQADKKETLPTGRMELVGTLENELLVYGPSRAGSVVRTVFGDVSGGSAADAAKLINGWDDELCGEIDGTQLRWGVRYVSDEDAAAVMTIGGESVNFRSLRTLFSALTNDAEIVLKTDCELKTSAVLTNAVTLASADPSAPCSVFLDQGAQFSVSNCTMTVDSVVLDGTATTDGDATAHRLRRSLFDVAGEGSSLAFTDVEVSNVRLISEQKEGVIYVHDGATFTMDGGSITGCTGEDARGVAVGVRNGTFNFCGGSITGCQGSFGAVHIDDTVGQYEEGAKSRLYVSGAVNVTGNTTKPRTGEPVLENVWLSGPEAMVVDGDLDAGSLLGITHNSLTNCFGSVSAGVADPSACFSNDILGDAVKAVCADGWLYWEEVPPPEPVPSIRLEKSTGFTTNYFTLGEAFAAADAGSTVTVTAPITIDTKEMPLWITCDLTLTAENNARVTRGGDSADLQTRIGDVETRGVIMVGNSAKVTVKDITFGPDEVNDYWTLPFFYCDAGTALTLGSGTYFTKLKINSKSDASCISAMGDVTMRPGTSFVFFSQCVNESPDAKAGAVSVMKYGDFTPTFTVEGGVASGSTAEKGGAVCIGTGVKVKIASGATIYSTGVNRNGLYYEDTEPLSVVGLCESGLYTLRFKSSTSQVCKNLFATADYDYSPWSLATTAIRFTNENTQVGAYAATNSAGEAAFIWTSAFGKDNDTYNEWTAITNMPPEPGKFPVALPTEVTGLTYDGNAKTGVVEGTGYTLIGNVATNAGVYEAKATPVEGYVWSDLGTRSTRPIEWRILKGTYDMSGITFANATYAYDGAPKSIFITGDLPAGVTVKYAGNGQTAVGQHIVTALFTGDEKNYYPIANKTATLTITKREDPDPDPQWTVVTNHPTPIAFKSIDRISDTEWKLVVTNRVEYCNYRLIWTKDLTKGFTSTGDWEHAVGEAAAPIWTTNVITTGGAWFWRAEGADGTNMVPPAVNQ